MIQCWCECNVGVMLVWVGVWLSVGEGTMPSTTSPQCNVKSVEECCTEETVRWVISFGGKLYVR